MMNKNVQDSHTEYPSSNAMEQAALLRARSALARWRCTDPVDATLSGTMKPQCQDARVRWYNQLEEGLHAWISQGGFAQRTCASEEASGHAEHPCIG